MAKKLDIKRELRSVDMRDYDFYRNLSDDERKEFSPYILMRYTSNVKGDSDTQEWFLERTNEYVNKYHWDLSKEHKDLLWKLFAATGTGIVCYHPYIASSKKEKTNKIEKLLAELNPTMKLSDIKLSAKMMTQEQKEHLLDSMGFDKKQRKEYE